MTRTNFFLSTLFLLLSAIALRAQEKTEIWQMPTAKLSMIINIDSDEQGNTYYAAMFAGDMTLSGNQLNASPSADILYARNSENEIIWTKLLPFTIKDIAASDDGVWILGQSSKSYILSDKSGKEFSKPIILIHFDSNGKLDYLAEGGNDENSAYATAIDCNNNEVSFIVSFEEKFNFEGRSIFADMQKNYAVIHLNNDKKMDWFHLLTGGDSYITGIWPYSLTHDAENNVWVVGRMSGKVSSGDNSHTTHKTTYGPGESLFDDECFLIKINQNGESESLKKIITEANPEKIIYLQDNTLLVSGYFNGNVTGEDINVSWFGDKKVLSTPKNGEGTSEDAFAAKFDLDGNCIWVARGKGSGDNRVAEAVEAPDGSIYLSGFGLYEFGFEGTTGEAPVAFVSGEGNDRYNFSDAFIIKLGPDGSLEWMKRGGGAKSDNLHCIHYSNGKIHAGGYFTAAITFDGIQVNMRSTYYSGVEITIVL